MDWQVWNLLQEGFRLADDHTAQVSLHKRPGGRGLVCVSVMGNHATSCAAATAAGFAALGAICRSPANSQCARAARITAQPFGTEDTASLLPGCYAAGASQAASRSEAHEILEFQFELSRSHD